MYGNDTCINWSSWWSHWLSTVGPVLPVILSRVIDLTLSWLMMSLLIAGSTEARANACWYIARPVACLLPGSRRPVRRVPAGCRLRCHRCLHVLQSVVETYPDESRAQWLKAEARARAQSLHRHRPSQPPSTASSPLPRWRAPWFRPSKHNDRLHPFSTFEMAPREKKERKARSALSDVVTREYTIHLHKHVFGHGFKKVCHPRFALPPIAISSRISRQNVHSQSLEYHMWLAIYSDQRAPKAVKAVTEFARKAMGTQDVRIDPGLNAAIWNHGIRNVPRRMRVRLARTIDFLVDFSQLPIPFAFDLTSVWLHLNNRST
jgi:large subunit ribosomal protein L31e